MEIRNPAYIRPAQLGTEESAHDSLTVHWRAVFAGVFIAFLVQLMLMSLGLAFGGGAVRENLLSNESVVNVAIGTGVWMIASILISLFLGSYAAGRASGIIATRIGYTQGAVITSLFFLALAVQIGTTMGTFTRGLANISSSVIGGVGQLSRNPQLLANVEDHVTDLKFKAPPGYVLGALTTRLIRGDTNSAANFLAMQTGMSPRQARVRIAAINADFRATMTNIAERASAAAARLGLGAFATILLGTISAMLGGGTGALVNLRKPLDRVDERALRHHEPALT